MCYVIVQNTSAKQPEGFCARRQKRAQISRLTPKGAILSQKVQDHIFYISNFGPINLTFLIDCIKV
jgi:hypothetical protein